MKKRFTLLLTALLMTIGVVAEERVAFNTQVSTAQLENGAVYTIQGYRSGLRYMYFDGTHYETYTTTTAPTDETKNNYYWSFYQSETGTRYLYNLGAKRFLGINRNGDQTIPLIASPVSKEFLVKDSEVTSIEGGNVIMMTSDNGGSAMHCANSGYNYEIRNWSGNWGSTATDVCAFRVVKIAELDASTLQHIEEEVRAFEVPPAGLVYNAGDGEYNTGNNNSIWRNGWQSTNENKPSFTISVGANNMNSNITDCLGLRPGNSGCNYTFTTASPMVRLTFEALSISTAGGIHTININGETKNVESEWTTFTIDNINATTATFQLSGNAQKNDYDCLVRNIRITLKQDLYNTSNGSLEVPPYRIPGITTDPETGRLITAAARLVCGTDPGYGEVDIVCRISDNHGDTWGSEIVVADGSYTDEEQRNDVNVFTAAFGDPAIVADRTTDEVLVIAVAGCTVYGNGRTTRDNPNMIATIHSLDNGNTWETPVDVTEDIYGLFDDGNTMQAAFVGGGKIFQSRTVKVGDHYRLYAAMCARPNGNRVIYSDDFGHTWHALGGASALPAPGGNEPKCEELPDGRVVLSSRVEGGRIYNIYTYTNTATAQGSWSTSVKSTFEGAGHGAGSNSTNGELLIVPVQRNSDGKAMYLALQSLPTGSGRSHVGIFYKELTDLADINSVEAFATDWNGFFLVTDKASAYSSMDLQNDDRIGFIYEETLTKWGEVANPTSTNFPDGEGTHNYDGFDNIYVAYDLEHITNGAYSINRKVDRRDYLHTYFTALAADISDDVKTSITTALDAMSEEPTAEEMDHIYRLIASDAWYYIGYKEEGRNYPTLPSGSWGYLTDALKFTVTLADAQRWRKIESADGTFQLVSKLGKYLVPAESITASPTAPDKEWTIEESDVAGRYVIYYAEEETQMHANKNTSLTNWGYNNECTGPRKNDAGCQFVFVEAAEEADKATARARFENDAEIGKVGYYSQEAVDEYLAAVEGALTIAQIDEATATLQASTRQTPVNGVAYTFKNVHTDGTTCWITYDAANSKKLGITSTEGEATPFVCRTLDNGKCVFVCNDGKYLAWQGSTSHNLRDDYDTSDAAYTDVSIVKLTTGDKVDGDQTDTRYVYIQARRSANDANGCIIIKKSGLTYDDSSSPFYNSSYSSAILVEEATYANTPQLRSVGTSKLLSESLHHTYMGTFSAPFATLAPENVTAYYAKQQGEYIELVAIAEDEAIPANTGVILVGNTEGNAVMVPAASETKAATEDNLMGHSAGAAKNMTNETNAYLFTMGDQGAGLYPCSGGTLAMNKAYMSLATQQAPALRMRIAGEEDGGTTAIDLSATEAQPIVIYDLQGRRVDNPAKGIYIVNGKKVIK